MNQVIIEFWENKEIIKCYSQSSVLYINNMVNDLSNVFGHKITEIKIKIYMEWDTIPALSIENQMLLFCFREKPLVKIIWIVGKCQEQRTAFVQSEWNLTGQFKPQEITVLFNKRSNYEYYNKSFGEGRKHSAWCLNSSVYLNEHISKELEQFLTPLALVEKEIRYVKKNQDGYIILENILTFPKKGMYEIVLDKIFWNYVERSKVDCIDFDVCIED